MLVPEKQISSMGFTRLLLIGNDIVMKVIPRRKCLLFCFYFFSISVSWILIFVSEWCVDVEDTARLHVIALLDPDVQSERIFAAARPFTWTEVLHILRTLRP